VEVLRHAQPLALLRVQHAPDALAPLVDEPVEHVVEGARELRGLRRAADHEPRSGRQRVERVGEGGEPSQGRERAADEHGVDHQHRGEADDEHAELPDGHAGGDRVG
jgi:hypothetical protein